MTPLEADPELPLLPRPPQLVTATARRHGCVLASAAPLLGGTGAVTCVQPTPGSQEDVLPPRLRVQAQPRSFAPALGGGRLSQPRLPVCGGRRAAGPRQPGTVRRSWPRASCVPAGRAGGTLAKPSVPTPLCQGEAWGVPRASCRLLSTERPAFPLAVPLGIAAEEFSVSNFVNTLSPAGRPQPLREKGSAWGERERTGWGRGRGPTDCCSLGKLIRFLDPSRHDSGDL